MNEEKKSFPTLKDIKASHGWKKNYEKYLFLSRFLFRPIGFLLTWICIRIGLTTENVAWLSGIAGITGCIFITSDQTHYILTGILLLLFFNLLDCVDGSIARTTKTENPYGKFLDSVCGGIVDHAFWGAIGIMAFRNEEYLLWSNPFGAGSLFWLLTGGAVLYLYAYLSYIENIFGSTLRQPWNELRGDGTEKVTPETGQPSDGDIGARYIIRMINNNFRVRENHYLLLLICFISCCVDVMLLIYFLYYLSQVALSLIIFAGRGRRIKLIYQKKVNN